MALAHEARCATHPETQATAVCERCGLFLCGDCIGMFGTELPCDRCAGLARGEQTWHSSSSWLCRVAATLCFAGFFLWPLAALGVPLALTELWRMHTGRAPAGGRRLTWFALASGLAGLGMLAAFIMRSLHGRH